MNPFTPLFLLLGGSLASLLADQLLERVGAARWRGCLAACILAVALMLFTWEAYLGVSVAEFRLIGPESPLTASLKLDHLSLYISIIFCGLGLAACIYSIKYLELESETGIDRYYLLLLTLIAGLVGVTLADDFFTLYVFWELMALSSYSLVAFRKWSWEAVEAGFKYLVMSTMGSLAVLLGIAVLYGIAGSLRFDILAQSIPSGGPAALLALALIIVGFGVTAAAVPFHSWLPDAHPAAPTPISAILSGIVIKAGAYAMLWSLFKLFTPTVYGFGVVLIAFGILTMSFANIVVVMQGDIKRFLAYSSIANMGYIITGMGIAAYILRSYPSMVGAAALALTGALLHILNHALGKGLLFLCAGCYILRQGSREISELEGVGAEMPATTASFGIGLLNLAGVPPLSGFWSKFFIVSAGLGIPSDGLLLTTTLIFILNSVLAAGYYLWLLQRIAFKRRGEADPAAGEAPALMLAPVIALAAACILITITISPVLEFIRAVLGVLLG